MLDVDSMKLAQTLCSLTPGPSLTIGFSGRRLALFVARGGDGKEEDEHLLTIYKPTLGPKPKSSFGKCSDLRGISSCG